MTGSHALKAGVDAQFIGDERVQGENFQYTFPTIDSYLAAKNGANPFGYTSLQQTFGQLDIDYSSRFYGFFVQDDWQIRRASSCSTASATTCSTCQRPRPFAANTYNGSGFTIDKNNWGPRAGVSWSLDEAGQTVLRASVGQDVRAAADRLLRQLDPEQRRSDPLQRVGCRFGGRRSGVPDQPGVGAGRLRACRVRASTRSTRRSRRRKPG